MSHAARSRECRDGCGEHRHQHLHRLALDQRPGLFSQSIKDFHDCQELEIDFSRRAAEYAEVTLSIIFSRVLWEYTELTISIR